MSGIPRVDLGDLDGTHGWVKTSGFVSWIDDVASHRPYQRVGLSDDTTDGYVVCTVWTDEIEFDKGAGYHLGGVDDMWEDGNEIQLKLYESSWAREFWSRD
jgi:hypothetical protein